MEQKENLAHIVKMKHKAEEISGQWQPLPHPLVPPSPRHPKPLHFPFSFCRRGTCAVFSITTVCVCCVLVCSVASSSFQPY